MAWINLLSHGLCQVGISHAGFTVIQKGNFVCVLWVPPSLIQSYKGLSPGPSQTALLAASGETVQMLWVVLGRSMDQAPPEAANEL